MIFDTDFDYAVGMWYALDLNISNSTRYSGTFNCSVKNRFLSCNPQYIIRHLSAGSDNPHLWYNTMTDLIKDYLELNRR